MRLIPQPFKGISLAVLAAVMFTPGQAAGNSGEIAPAMIGVFYAILMKDFSAALGAAVPILRYLLRCLWWVQLGRWFEVCLWLMLKSRLG